jgi:aryl-alcohol dehydrogenase-like predicted oxidoreductase
MHQRKLGTQGLVVSEMGLGCMGMTWAYGTPDPAEAEATLRRAVELGVTFFDTAEIYGPFTNEELVGRVLKPVRDRVVIATKFGFRFEDGKIGGPDSRPENVRRACDASLKRLGLDHVDLFYQHRVDPAVPIEDTVGAMAELVTAGKVKYLGLSEAGPATIRRAHAVHPISALQSEYSLWTRDHETTSLPACRELGIGFVAYSPLGRGFLTGAIASPDALEANDWRRTNPRFSADAMTANATLVAPARELAARKGCTPGQVALAWVLAKGEDIVPIPGTKRVRWLEENLAATNVWLTGEEMAWLDEVCAPGAAVGSRYSEAAMKALDAAR